ncbi:hypothetical protein PV327_003064 [Microctonus hyperodae]|uniref:SCP domain-containing protein n=1 Tax=Microctonus hyperodae TaxID=165561 RepID=A0AA39G379_MICHY|nr:hypothetical protein PV327_003064 [Microctonus hyperodae]
MMMLSARGPAPTTDAHLAASLSVAVRRLAVSESAHPRLWGGFGLSINLRKANSVGQNLYMMGSSEKSENTHDILTASVNSWYSEVKDFDNRSVREYKFEFTTGHYSQVVWGDTTHVGCGLVQYKDSGFYTTMVACNYSPAGNLIGGTVYPTL